MEQYGWAIAVGIILERLPVKQREGERLAKPSS